MLLSKSVITDPIAVPPLSIAVGATVSICKKVASTPLVETNVGISLIANVSLGVTLALKAANVWSLFVPS